MHRLLVTPQQLASESLTLDRDQSRHLITVLRAKLGEPVLLFDGRGATRHARINTLARDTLSFAMEGDIQTHPPHNCDITLFACVSKGARMEWLIEKATEMGVHAIMPVISERTIARPSDSARWLRIAAAAARQSCCNWLPAIVNPVTFTNALAVAQECEPLLVAALVPQARPLRQVIDALPPPKQAAIFIGPEGDFTAQEYAALSAIGAKPISLGRQILRSETACIYALAVIAASWL